MKKTGEWSTKWMVEMGILLAVMIIFAFTPLGYLKVGVIEITLMVLPVAVGAIILGPTAGAILGTFFGITSLIQCFGMSAFGAFLMTLSPVGTVITCIVPRFLCGWLAGLLYKALAKHDRTRILSNLAASIATALLNTVFFMTAIILLFWKNPLFIDQMLGWGMATDTIWMFLVVFVGVNGIVEAAINAVAATAISRVGLKIHNRTK